MSKEPLIHKDMVVGEIVGMFPEAADIITSYGLHCVGCHANAFETLEQGLLGHGYTEENLNSLVSELNEYWEEMHDKKPKKIPKAAEKMKITVTPFAIKKMKEIAAKEEKKEIIIRIEGRKMAGAVKFSMNFISEPEINLEEKVFTFEKGVIRIVASKHDYKMINGLNVDYVMEEDRQGFKMRKE